MRFAKVRKLRLLVSQRSFLVPEAFADGPPLSPGVSSKRSDFEPAELRPSSRKISLRVFLSFVFPSFVFPFFDNLKVDNVWRDPGTSSPNLMLPPLAPPPFQCRVPPAVAETRIAALEGAGT